MKKLFLLLSLFIIIGQTSAQDKVFERRGSGIYVELLGNGIGYSLNYESRFSNSNRKIGGRIGIAYYAVEDKPSVVVPVIINYLLGKPEGKHFLDLGAGATFLSKEGVFINSDDDKVIFTSKAYATFSIKYHYHPPFGGFLFKFGLTPFIGTFEGQDGPFFLSAGCCLGYAF